MAGRKMINKVYQLYYITKNFSFQLLWFGSCFALMFGFPFLMEQMSEQQKLIYKIQLDMASTGALDGAMGGAGGGANDIQIRPF